MRQNADRITRHRINISCRIYWFDIKVKIETKGNTHTHTSIHLNREHKRFAASPLFSLAASSLWNSYSIYCFTYYFIDVNLLIQTRVYKLFCSSYNLFIIKIRSRAECARIAYSFHARFLSFNHSLCLLVNTLVSVCVRRVSVCVSSVLFYTRLRSMNYSVWIC